MFFIMQKLHAFNASVEHIYYVDILNSLLLSGLHYRRFGSDVLRALATSCDVG
jgi:hypothetical protein